MNEPFARTTPADERARRELEAQRLADLRASLTRLVKDEDFRQWFQYVNWQLCGGELSNTPLDEFAQGKRSVMGFLKRSIALADGGPEYLAELTRKHFTAVAKAKTEARARQTDGD